MKKYPAKFRGVAGEIRRPPASNDNPEGFLLIFWIQRHSKLFNHRQLHVFAHKNNQSDNNYNFLHGKK